ncbi:MAG: RNA-guided endonuclease InsQ/TnpB family protein [Bacillota bacterium]
MFKTFRYRIYPNREQAARLDTWLELCRQLYNCALEQRILAYRLRKKAVTRFEQMAELPSLKQEFPEYAGVHSQVLQEVLKRLDRAFNAFFSRLAASDRAGFPRFKGKNRFHSLVFPQMSPAMLPDGSHIVLPKLGRVKIKLSRPLAGRPKTCTVVRKNGRYYVCFSCETESAALPGTGKQTGIDMGLACFVATADGRLFDSPRSYRKAERLLKRKGRQVSRRQRGSKRRQKAVRELARLHERVANQRRDMAHKVARYLVQNYDLIAFEALKVKNMLQNHRLAKSIQDAGWRTFLTILSGKAAEAGRTVVEVPPAGTSQNCSGCGQKVPKTLSVRIHRCPHCGLVLHRDVNAARNIMLLALSG